MSNEDSTTINSLAAKIDAVDLTDEELALLDAVLARAAMAEPEDELDEVSGFAVGVMALDGLTDRGELWAGALGVLGRPSIGPITAVGYGYGSLRRQ